MRKPANELEVISPDRYGRASPLVIDVWVIDTSIVRPDRTSQGLPILSDEERERAQRFVFSRDSDRYLSRRISMRRILAGYLGISPRDIQYAFGTHGKPRLGDTLAVHPGLEFNLSHSQDMAVLAVTRGISVGIDIERMTDRESDALPIDVACSPAENKLLSRLTESQRASAFWRIWTGKEAYLKAEGCGLSVEPTSFGFTPQTIVDGSAELAMDRHASPPWRFPSFHLRNGYLTTLAVQTDRFVKMTEHEFT